MTCVTLHPPGSRTPYGAKEPGTGPEGRMDMRSTSTHPAPDPMRAQGAGRRASGGNKDVLPTFVPFRIKVNGRYLMLSSRSELLVQAQALAAKFFFLSSISLHVTASGRQRVGHV